MANELYSVTSHSISNLLGWIDSGNIAIPEIQRPFVWSSTQVRDLLDSLYRGFPVGYIITWQNPNVRLKDGSTSSGQRILIDGQQRVTALMTSLRGIQVIDKDYTKRRIRIAFNPVEERFEVTNPAIERDSTWIADVSEVLKPGAQIFSIMNTYLTANPDVDQNQVTGSIQRLKDMDVKQVGVIQLAEHLDIETVNEIFIRVNSKGVSLSQADFVMSKIAASEQYGGHQLRKAIDYFSRLSRYPDFLETIGRDSEFKPEYLNKMRWLASYDDDIYQPDYTDMLRVAFTSEFGRGRLQDLVALLSGRDFETKQNFESIAEESFARLEAGVLQFMNETHFKRFAMIIRSAGFITPKLLNSGNALNFAYVVYLKGRADGIEQHHPGVG